MGRIIKRKNVKEEDAEYIKKGTHSHAPDVRNKLAAQTLHGLKVAAKESKEKARNLVTNTVEIVDAVVAPVLPTMTAMTRMVNRIRQKENIIPNPRNLNELKLDKILTEKGVNLLLYDNESDNDRLIIFATVNNLQMLSNADVIFSDGTFSITPPLFEQLYTNHGMFD